MPTAASTPLPPTNTAPMPTVTPWPTYTPLPTPRYPTMTPGTPTPVGATVEQINADVDAMLQDLAKRSAFSGSVLLARAGEVILSSGYGFADRDQKTPNTLLTRFRIASITKQFTAMAIIILQSRGKLDVQDPACKYLTKCPKMWESITIHHLLTHTAGIPDVTESPEDILLHYGDTPLDFSPGEKFNYSDGNYIMLGQIVEQASGQPYEIFLKENIFEPLNMKNTSFDDTQNKSAIGYADPFYEVPFFELPENYPAGGLYSTVEDLYRYDQALYTERLIPRALLEKMFTPSVTIESFIFSEYIGWSYGYGWFVGKESNHREVSHRGFIDGFVSILARYPDDKVTIIILSNQQNIIFELEKIQFQLFSKVFNE
jgi:CubicO group peptidase (beta-lactamase class C family)